VRDLTNNEYIITLLFIWCAGNYYRDVIDDNQITRYGEESKLPANCRALIKANMDDYLNRLRSYNPTRLHNDTNQLEYANEVIFLAQDGLASLDRNCGENGTLWDVTIQNKKFFN